MRQAAVVVRVRMREQDGVQDLHTFGIQRGIDDRFPAGAAAIDQQEPALLLEMDHSQSAIPTAMKEALSRP